MRRANDEKMGLKRKELFWCNKLAAERAADAVQRACDAAAAAEVAFVPSHKFPAARSLALRTWAREPCKIDAYEYADEKYGVKDLERHEPDALMTIEVFKLSVVVGVSGLTGGAMIAFVSATVREAAAPN